MFFLLFFLKNKNKKHSAQVLFVVREYVARAVAVSAWWQESLHGLIYPVAPSLLQRAAERLHAMHAARMAESLQGPDLFTCTAVNVTFGMSGIWLKPRRPPDI